MSNELDLDALAEQVADLIDWPLVKQHVAAKVIDDLISELRTCRAERDRLSEVWDADLSIVEDLAVGWMARAERAEARIAAALEEHEPRSTYGPGPADSLHPDDKMCRRCKAVWPCATARALTGGDQ